MKFSYWLEQQESQVAKFLEEIIDKAADIKRQNIQSHFLDCLKRVWPGEHFILPNSLPEVAGRPVHFGHYPKRAQTNHQGNQFAGFVFNIEPFDRAAAPVDIDQAVEAIKMAIHHEVEHIHNVGGTSGPDDTQSHAISYMSNPNEIKAHAREIAYAYSKKFPGQPFDLHKAQSMLDQPGFNTTHSNYLKSLSGSEIQNQLIHLIQTYLGESSPQNQ